MPFLKAKNKISGLPRFGDGKNTRTILSSQQRSMMKRCETKFHYLNWDIYAKLYYACLLFRFSMPSNTHMRITQRILCDKTLMHQTKAIPKIAANRNIRITMKMSTLAVKSQVYYSTQRSPIADYHKQCFLVLRSMNVFFIDTEKGFIVHVVNPPRTRPIKIDSFNSCVYYDNTCFIVKHEIRNKYI